jgi:uncharacterized protein with PQ loop repeat
MFLQWILRSWLIACSVIIQLFTLQMQCVSANHQHSTTFWSPAFFWCKSLNYSTWNFHGFLEYW